MLEQYRYFRRHLDRRCQLLQRMTEFSIAWLKTQEKLNGRLKRIYLFDHMPARIAREQSGGCTLAPGGAFIPGTPAGNIRALVEAAEQE